MDFSRSNTRLARFGLPLVTFALCIATPSAAAMFKQAPHDSSVSAPQKRRIVGRGYLTGTRKLQQVVTWRTADATHLAIETAGPHPRVLWQADEPFSFFDITSVRVTDLNGDAVPEIVSLWWKGEPAGAMLRVFHWYRSQQSFVELQLEDEPSGVLSYRIKRAIESKQSSRITVYVRSNSGARPSPVSAGEYEMRGAKLVRVGGGATVPSQDESGIEGQAVISPARPGPVIEGETNTVPHRTTLIVRRMSDGREVARVETGSDGRFRVALPPGTYKVGAPPLTGRFLPRGSEETVTVVPGRFVLVTIGFDSGMR